MSEFLQRVESEIQKRGLLPHGRKILVAVSGGVDSMALLRILHLLAPKNRWQISVAHFNHQLRGRASDADEKLVRSTAKRLSLPFIGGQADVAGFARQSRLSVEMAARKLRHEFLARVARERKLFVIALAHHADDQVELFFLRLLRGAGGDGLAGMKWRSPSPAAKTISLVRPLLGFSKGEIVKFARENKIHFRDDATNDSSDFQRNRIRNELLPLLRRNYQPGLDRAILRLMDIVGAEAEFAGEAAESWLPNFRSRRGNEAQTKRIGKQKAERGNMSEPLGVVVGSFDELPLAVQRKVLQHQLAGLGLMPDFELIEQLRAMPGQPVSLASHLSVARDAAGRLNCREHPVKKKFLAGELKMKLQGKSGAGEFAGRSFGWRREAMKSFALPKKSEGRENFDADKVGGEIILRHWRPGDRFQPLGLSSPAKLQNLFTNAKISSARRRGLVLATTSAGQIFWVEGLRMAESFKLTPDTNRLLVWRWRAVVRTARSR